jgi:exodeoxyribonuclease-1
MTYLFYDIETTGLNKAFDQILRFAAVRTDERFRELDRRQIDVRLRDDIIPSPSALLTHRISIEEARTEGISELEAVREIHQLMNTPGTVSLGYNTLGFDDEFLRFSFYRNLLPPYTHQWKNDCGRMDIYPMTVVYRLRGSDLLEWPVEDGRSSFRLEDLSAANDLSGGRAHTAMADTEATVELARSLAQNRTLWNDLSEHFDKQLDEGRYMRLPRVGIGDRAYPVGVVVSARFGEDRNYQRPVISLGKHRTYSNQVRLLVLDSEQLRSAGEDEIPEVANILHKKFGVPDFLYSSHDSSVIQLTHERRKLANENIHQWREDPAMFERLVDRYLGDVYMNGSDVDVDAALYEGGFWDRETEDRCAAFHAASSLKERLSVLDSFRQPALRELGRRILVRNFPSARTTPDLQEYSHRYMRQIFPDDADRVPVDHREQQRRTPAAVLQDIDERRRQEDLDREQRGLLTDLEQYITDRFLG